MLKALLFDVQGTATDFHSTVCGEAQRISAGRHPDGDWPVVIQRWRAAYFAELQAGPTGRGEWVPVRSVYRDVLDTVLDECGVTGFSGAQRDELTLAWQRLVPWPDVVPGLTRMRTAFTLATLSNADVCAVVNMAGAFKPDPAVYHMAATYLGLDPAEIMMVASHKYDIRAAGGLGFRTAFVARPLELGVGGEVDVSYEDEFDINASDFLDLADQLGC